MKAPRHYGAASEGLLDHESGTDAPFREPHTPTGFKRVGFAALLVVAGIIGGSVLLAFQPPQAFFSQPISAKKTSYIKGFKALNLEYSDEPITLPLYKVTNGEQIVEPYRDITLRALTSGLPDSATLRWTITRESPLGLLSRSYDGYEGENDSREVTGQDATHHFHGAGYRFRVKVQAIYGNEILDSHESTLSCLYVRREIRQITGADREQLLDAMWIMYSTSGDEGRTKYGDSFLSMDEIDYLHNQWAGNMSCDHLHEGAGFATQHVALNLRYEMSAQTIHPRIILPYWEYTQDSSYIEDQLDGDYDYFYEIAPVFHEDWFGPVDNMTYPWNTITVPLASGDELQNPYGYLRSPWNSVQDHTIQRFKSRCGYSSATYLADMEGYSNCKAYADVLEDTDFDTFQSDLMHAPHGSIHIMIGGVGGKCVTEYPRILKGHFTSHEIMLTGGLSAVTVKQLWRDGYLKLKTCSLETPEECGQYCTDYYEAGLTAIDFMSPWGISANNSEAIVAMGQALCDTPLEIGDMYASSAAMDPIFWLMHTATERLLTFKRMKVDGLPTSSWHKNSCYGHSPNDPLIYDVREYVGATNQDIITGKEFLQLAVPTWENYSLPYAYNSFLYEHCNHTTYPQFAWEYSS